MGIASDDAHAAGGAVDKRLDPILSEVKARALASDASRPIHNRAAQDAWLSRRSPRLLLLTPSRLRQTNIAAFDG
jgi:hypothetical protein